MAAFSRVRLRVSVEGQLELAPGTLYVVTHRSNLDTPLVCGALYPFVRRQRRSDYPWFVVRDDMLQPGFFAQFAPGRTPLGLDIGPILERHLRCVAIRSATRMRVVELIRADPAAPLETLPNAADLRARARVLGHPEPAVAGDALRSAYADLLWRAFDRADAPEPRAAWDQRAADSRHDLERLVGLLRDGQSVLLSPEGTPSPDGAVGPVMRGVGLLVRRGRPQRVVPIGLAFDPLEPGRTHGLVRIGEPVDPPTTDVELSLHLLLRRTLPRSAGAARAHAYRRGTLAGPLPAAPDVIDRLAREYESAL
jgi:1-acyl-sn-glycerol-3-phosphate acyltransferase